MIGEVNISGGKCCKGMRSVVRSRAGRCNKSGKGSRRLGKTGWVNRGKMWRAWGVWRVREGK